MALIVQVQAQGTAARKRPLRAFQPASAMLQSAVLIFRTIAPAHQKYLDRRRGRSLAGLILERACKPVQSTIQPGARDVAIEVGRHTELDIAAMTDVAIAVQPRSHDQVLGAAVIAAEGTVVGQRRADISVVPTGHEQHRNIRQVVVVSFGIDAGLAPVIAESTLRPLFQ
ncbi:hypothetical protein D3C87_1347580 [compost metagenome]